jgi:polysaccharide export outer membrane protein
LAAHETASVGAGTRSVRVDLVSATTEGNGGGYYLPDGSIVTVERRDPEPVQLQGLVQKPDLYDYPVGKELRLLGAISLAGGISNPVADKVYIIRSRPGVEEPILIQASLKKAKHHGEENIRLAPGDVVSVEPTTSTVLIDTIRVIGFTIGGSVF